jgi:transcriptional regulator with XRE-family HTH domain
MNTRAQQTLTQRLRAGLLATGKTQKEIAACTGMAQTTVSRIMSGRVHPRLDTADLLFRWIEGQRK